MSRFDVIGFDADDTLWHNERAYAYVQTQFIQLLAEYQNPDVVEQTLNRIDMRNLPLFGYGIKSYALSLIEAAVEISYGAVKGYQVKEIIDLAKNMLTEEVELYDFVAETLERLAVSYPLMLITKGDLLDQEIKINRSGLRKHVKQIEIVSDKSEESYASIFKRHHLLSEKFLMVGNSLRSDIWPVLNLGGQAVYLHQQSTWIHEVVDPPDANTPGYYRLGQLRELPQLLEQIDTD